jgi:hypothetical protein
MPPNLSRLEKYLVIRKMELSKYRIIHEVEPYKYSTIRKVESLGTNRNSQ